MQSTRFVLITTSAYGSMKKVMYKNDGSYYCDDGGGL